ncbi:MAG: thioredoxin domain-containing protein [Candidatus Micrarchaeota archaeon]
MKLVVCLIALLLLSGCISQTADKIENKTTDSIGNNGTNRINDTSDQNATVIVESQGLQVIYFYSPTCPACQQINGTIVNITNKYSEDVELVMYNVRTENGYSTYQEYANRFNLTNKQRLIPLIYVEDSVLNGFAEIRNGLESSINKALHSSE